MARYSPCLRDNEIKQARSESLRAKDTGIAPENSSLHLQLIALEEDIKRLKQLSRIADKVAMKRNELLPKYMPYVERYLAEGDVFANQVFAYVVIWLFDTEQFDQAIEWAFLCIEQGQPTPDSVKRDWPHFAADVVLAWCEVQAERGNSVEPYCSTVFKKVSNEWRLNEKLTAKWFKFCGLLLLRDIHGKALPSSVESADKLQQATELLMKAQEFNPKCGVKTVLDKIDMRLRALTDS
ncbi:terminase [Photobacterium rosenbergii]|uniref:Terminase n=1 Tax=Photobacterium rosenbergii TaxID=294936 RepID=A0A2T3NHG8_9GAMM|nr:phage terminase small subunit [Photobacterium rosenbergii]PSW14410.1 terminase [Photobacterium rosenbergii]